jgi:hypothetical protein
MELYLLPFLKKTPHFSKRNKAFLTKRVWVFSHRNGKLKTKARAGKSKVSKRLCYFER